MRDFEKILIAIGLIILAAIAVYFIISFDQSTFVIVKT